MELRNYRKFRQASLELPEGVVGILGSNGSGKSTLMEAVAWALYGNEKMIIRDGKKEGVRSSFAAMNDDCSVLLEFEISGDHYRLYRAMKGKSQLMDAQLSVNGKQLAKTDKGVTDEIRRVLGMDYKSFFISVFARQKELNALSSLSASERGKVVRRMLGIENLTRTVEEIDRERKSVQDRLFGAQQDLLGPDGRSRSSILRAELSETTRARGEVGKELGSLVGKQESLDAEASEAMSRRDALTRKEEEHRGLATERLSRSKDMEAALSNAQKERARIQDLERKREEMAALLDDHDDYERTLQRKEALDGIAQSYERRRMLERQRSEAEGKLTVARGEVGERLRSAAACSDSKKRLQTVEESWTAVTQERDSLRSNVRLKEAEVARLSKESERTGRKLEEIKRLGPEGACPTCERKLCDQHTFLVAKLETEISELIGTMEAHRKELEGFKQELEQRAQRLENLDKRRKELQGKCEEEVRAQEALRASNEKLTAVEEEVRRLDDSLARVGASDYSEDEHGAVKKRLLALKARWERHRALRVELEALPVLEEELRAQESAASELGRRLEGIEERIAALGYREGERKEAQAALDSLLMQKDQLAKQVAQTDKRLERLKAEEAAKRQALEELERRERTAEDLTGQLEEQTALSKAMRDFRENMMARVVPTLSEISSRLFEEVTGGKYPGLELDNDYEISIYDKGEKHAVSRFSGGEADLANLCLRLAISKVIAERSGSALNLLILDEIFGSQDQERKRNIMEAFGQLSKQFSQIMLITHIEDVKDLVGGAIVVKENEDGSSEVSIVG